MSSSIDSTKTKLLIVEGKDEENFFTAAFSHLGINDIQVLPIGGKTNLKGNLKALKLDPAFPGIGCVAIVRDADLTPVGSAVCAADSAFQSVCSALSAAGVQLSQPAISGQFIAGPPKVGVFIMPDGKSDGMLETLCVKSISPSPEYTCVTDFFSCLARHRIVPGNIDKGFARAWLASRADPDKSVGQAALASNDPGKKYWALDDQAFADLWIFLRAM